MTLLHSNLSTMKIIGLCIAVLLALTARVFTQDITASDKEFQAALAEMDAAQRELQNGRPAAYKALWSHADDVTLSGGFGGTIEKGWDQVSRRLDWAGAQFSKGTNSIERVVVHASGDLAYLVQIEHLRFYAPGQATE